MQGTIRLLINILSLLLQVLSYAIIANALLSWFLPPNNAIRRVLTRICDPFVAPFRRLTSRFMTSGMPIDISPMLAYLAIALISSLLNRLMFMI